MDPQLLQVLTHLDKTLTTMQHDMGLLLTANLGVASAAILLSMLGYWMLARQIQQGHERLADMLRELRRGR